LGAESTGGSAERGMMMWRADGRVIQGVMFLSRWLLLPLLVGLVCSVVLIIIRFFIDLYSLAIKLPGYPWQDLLVGVLNLVDLTLTANLILIVVFSAFENYIRKIEPTVQPEWPPGLIDIDFSAVKQKLLGSITGIAAVDALAWYLHLEEYADTAKLTWVVVFPLMFVAAMAVMALADRLGRASHGPTQ
jgi:uncharacterized protein (TIGR00645 family)